MLHGVRFYFWNFKITPCKIQMEPKNGDVFSFQLLWIFRFHVHFLGGTPFAIHLILVQQAMPFSPVTVARRCTAFVSRCICWRRTCCVVRSKKPCKNKGTRERELLEIHWEFHSFQKKIQYNQTDFLRSFNNQTCFLCLFLMKKRFVHYKKITFAQDCCIKHFIQSTQAFAQHLKDRLVKDQSFRKS